MFNLKMKIHIFCLITCLLVFNLVKCDNALPKNPLEEEILSLLNKWRKGSVHTNLFPLPTLKSIDIKGIQSNYDGKGVKIDFSIGDMQLTGLNNFSVETIDVVTTNNALDIYTRISIPTLLLHADKYELHGRAYYVYPLKGAGKMKVVLQNNEVTLSVRFVNVSDIFTSIKDLSIKYKIGKVDLGEGLLRYCHLTADSNIEFSKCPYNIQVILENSSWPITKVLNSEGVNILDGYQEEINNAMRDYAVPYANHYLSDVTPQRFLNTIADISLNSYNIIEDNVIS